MNPVELIRLKRDGGTLTRDQIAWFITGFVRGDIPEYQMSAFLMAVYFRGMSAEETAAFTQVMLHSGTVVDLSSVPGRKVDKHSTGGVGDKVSLILAPMVAACGVPVPMISGGGLGHTGGTLDKLESIPGFRTDLTVDEYRRVIAEVGMVLIGQTAEIAPADRRMYALRDVTGTIESLPLIAGSIMSKKLAEGLDALVLDVKTGDGAFMRSEDDALALARALVGIGTAAGKTTMAFLTGMDQPLGFAVGNWCEVKEAVECLRGRTIADLMEVTTVLGGAMVMLGGKAATIPEGMALCRSAIWSGRAYEKFLESVRRQGGECRVLENTAVYPAPAKTREIISKHEGIVDRCDTRRLGLLAVELGAGRLRADDPVDHKAGILLNRKIGDRVAKGDVLAVVTGDREDRVDHVAAALASCLHLGPEAPLQRPCVRTVVDNAGTRPWVHPEVY